MRRGMKSAKQQRTDRSGEYGPANVLVTGGRTNEAKKGTLLQNTPGQAGLLKGPLSTVTTTFCFHLLTCLFLRRLYHRLG